MKLLQLITHNELTMEKNEVYTKAKQIIKNATTEVEIDKAISVLSRMPDYLDSAQIANECKDEWKKSFAKYNALATEYETISKNQSTERLQALKNGINQNSSKKSQLEQLLSSFSSNKMELDSIEMEIQDKKYKIDSLRKEGVSLGFFAFRRKKELFLETCAIQKEINPLSEKAEQLKKAIGGYSSFEEIKQDINAVNEKVISLQNELQEAERSAFQGRKSEAKRS